MIRIIPLGRFFLSFLLCYYIVITCVYMKFLCNYNISTQQNFRINNNAFVEKCNFAYFDLFFWPPYYFSMVAAIDKRISYVSSMPNCRHRYLTRKYNLFVTFQLVKNETFNPPTNAKIQHMFL